MSLENVVLLTLEKGVKWVSKRVVESGLGIRITG
jgi:hypothetical protein